MKEKILAILKSIAPEKDFVSSRDFIADELLDSFDIVLLTSAIEESFQTNIAGEKIIPENFSSVEALVNLVTESKLAV